MAVGTALPIPHLLGLGGWEVLLIFLIILIIFGPSKLPELARGIGEAIREFRKASQEPVRAVEETKKEARKPRTVRELAKELGIETSGKSDEELEEEIKALLREKGAS